MLLLSHPKPIFVLNQTEGYCLQHERFETFLYHLIVITVLLQIIKFLQYDTGIVPPLIILQQYCSSYTQLGSNPGLYSPLSCMPKAWMKALKDVQLLHAVYCMLWQEQNISSPVWLCTVTVLYWSGNCSSLLGQCTTVHILDLSGGIA